jgi:probable HAF family extracellular repeat protein
MVGGEPAQAEFAALPAIADTTLNSSNPGNNMGGYEYILSGAINSNGGGAPRRGLYLFDLAGSIPAGSAIQAVTLTLVVPSGNTVADSVFSLHRAFVPWGEGVGAGSAGEAAMVNEATWNERLAGMSAWSVGGGLAGIDYGAGASASTAVSGLGSYTWSGAGLVADAQSWLDNPADNHGWLLISDSEAALGTVRRFGSREDALIAPVLAIQYTAPVPEPSAAVLGLCAFLGLAFRYLRWPRSMAGSAMVESTATPLVRSVTNTESTLPATHGSFTAMRQRYFTAPLAVRLLTALCSVMFVCAGAAAATPYAIIDLGTLGGELSDGFGVNESGVVVGGSSTIDNFYRGFVATTGPLQEVVTLGGDSSVVRSINATGMFVGDAELANGETQAFWATDPTQPMIINPWGGAYSTARRTAGNYIVGQAETATLEWHAFRMADGVTRDLGTLGGQTSIAYGVNTLGQVVGQADTADWLGRAFYHAGGELDVAVDLGALSAESFAQSSASAINDSGWIVGWTDTGSFDTFDFETHAFLYKSGVMHDLGTLGQFASVAYDINDSGQVVGTAADAIGFLYEDSTGVMTDLNTLIPPSAGWSITSANAINDLGQIVATGFNGTEYHAVLLTPVPEPTALVLLLSIVVGMIFLARR